MVSRGDPRQSVWVHTTNALDPHTFAEQGRNWRQEPIGAAGRLYGEDTEEPRIKRPVHRWGQQTQSVGSGGGVPEPAAAAASSSAALNPWELLTETRSSERWRTPTEEEKTVWPSTWPARTLQEKRGRVCVRSWGSLGRFDQTGDLLVRTQRMQKQMFERGNAQGDGTDPMLQEQLMSCQPFRETLQLCFLHVKRQLSKHRTFRVGVESVQGRFRSVAFAELLAARLEPYAEVSIEHLEEAKWKLERRETRKVGQREEKRTREAGTKMQCSTW